MARKSQTTTEKETNPVDELRMQLQAHAKTGKDLKRQLKTLETKARYRPNDEHLAAELDGLIEALAEHEADHEALTDSLEEARTEYAAERARREAQIYRDRADSLGYRFEVPDDVPLVGCTVLAAIAQQLQYEFVRSQAPYEALTAKVYRHGINGDGAGEATGTHDDPSYEYNRSDVEKLDAMRERREYVQTLRMAIKRDFEAMRDKLPEDAPFVPQLYRQSDHQRFMALEERAQQRFAEQQDARRQAGEAARTFGRSELELFS